MERLSTPSERLRGDAFSGGRYSIIERHKKHRYWKAAMKAAHHASIHDQEYEAMSKICELEKQLNMKTEEIEKMKGTGRGVYALPGIV